MKPQSTKAAVTQIWSFNHSAVYSKLVG